MEVADKEHPKSEKTYPNKDKRPSAIEKLEDMTDEEYSCLELVPDFI